MYTKRAVNHIQLVCIVILLGLFVTACSQGGSYRIGMGGIQTTGSSISGSYSSFSGHYFKKINLKEQDKIVFDFNINTENGSIDAQLIDPAGNIVSKIKEGAEQEKIIRKSGRYKVKVIAENHKGGFLLSWKIN